MAESSCVTLEQAIRDKYCAPLEEEGISKIRETAMGYKPGGCDIGRRHNIVLDGSGVKCVGSRSELAALCPSVKELHLAENDIRSWEDVCIILSSLPLLTLVDLSRNPLHSETFNTAAQVNHVRLTALVLNSTDISWSTLQTCLQMFPSLQELHLCNNNYSAVDFDPSFSLPSVKKLYMNNTHISKWEELAKLSPAFPSLQSLVMCDIPLEEIPVLDVPCAEFQELVVLNLNGSLISQWSSVEHLSALVKLTELNLMKVLLGTDLEAKERRFATVARLPALNKLNKTSISATEREDAERWFIRQHSDSQHPLVGVLIEKHGQVPELADVDLDLNSKTKITLEFHFNGQCTSYEISLKQSTKQLKAWVGMPPSTFRIFYRFPAHWTEMKVPAKNLYTYPIEENEKILIEMKNSYSSH